MTAVPWILVIVGVLLALTPKWTRPDLFFAVTVQTGFAFSAQGRRIVHRYWIEIALHTLLAIALAGLAGMNTGNSALLGIGWQLIGSSWAVARAHRLTRNYAATPSPVREAAIGVPPEKLPGGWPVAFGPLVFLAAAAVYAWIFWENLPDRIPVHWGLQGADRWIDRSPSHVFGFLALLGSYCAMFLLLSYGMVRWSRRISVTGERGRGESRFRRYVLWLLIGSQYLVVVPAVFMAFSSDRDRAPWSILSLLVMTAAVIVLARMGQGGSRLTGRTEYQPPIGDKTPDDAWKFGLFYYNPDDPTVIVEKRFGLGYTFNFGNVWSWVVLIALLAPVAFVIALS